MAVLEFLVDYFPLNTGKVYLISFVIQCQIHQYLVKAFYEACEYDVLRPCHHRGSYGFSSSSPLNAAFSSTSFNL
jgi:hypothetical protein